MRGSSNYRNTAAMPRGALSDGVRRLGDESV